MTAPVDRWRATIFYRTETGTVDVDHDLREIGDIDALVEAGPHWDTIEKIEIYRVNHVDSPTLTVETAKQL